MLFLDCTHWMLALHDGSFVVSMKEKMNTKQVIAVTGASGKMGSALAERLPKGNYTTENGKKLLDKYLNERPTGA